MTLITTFNYEHPLVNPNNHAFTQHQFERQHTFFTHPHLALIVSTHR